MFGLHYNQSKARLLEMMFLIRGVCFEVVFFCPLLKYLMFIKEEKLRVGC